MLLNNQQIIEEIKKEVKICIEMNEKRREHRVYIMKQEIPLTKGKDSWK